jgi:hypothetical protein
MTGRGRSSHILKAKGRRSDGITSALTQSFPCPRASGSAPRSKHPRSHTRRACGPRGADPARRGQAGESSEPRQGSTVLTDLLTTPLDLTDTGGLRSQASRTDVTAWTAVDDSNSPRNA